MRHIGSNRPMIPYHDHNADQMRPELLNRLSSEAIALVSDAGTPLISDAGFKLVRVVRAAGHYVTTLSGRCAAIAALTVAGLPPHRFMLDGFLSANRRAGGLELGELASSRSTLIGYET